MYISQERLKAYIKYYARTHVEHQQVFKRLKELRSERLKKIRDSYQQYRGGKKSRLALLDPRYRECLEQMITVMTQAQKARIEWETHKMLYQARKYRSFSMRPPQNSSCSQSRP